ncbi:DegV family protein [Tepidanaerobacter sp. EBM-49]|uniref:DegV family protein n=1 Tax=Tepidanaerobacter sp. EBM-49 TaxID=1918504 RepID=UPI000A57E0BD|nr:DegV family protein [Tepidanaerobacter sp. EBM-49]
MKKIALVTDSTADLPEEIRTEYDIHVVPLKVRFKDKEYLDYEIAGDKFYELLNQSDELPTTSQPSPEDFRRLYEELLEEYDEVVSIHISSGLSGTINAANVAAEKFGNKVHIVDSKTISLGIGLMTMEAAEIIKTGVDAAKVVERLSEVRKNVELLFTLNTLEYLQKGGRIGRVQGIVGTLLNIKPIVRVGDDGIYQTYSKARSQEKALKTIIQAFEDMSRVKKCKMLVVAHGAAEEAGLYLKGALESMLGIKAKIFTQVGPIIGVHTGPGTVGAAVLFG